MEAVTWQSRDNSLSPLQNKCDSSQRSTHAAPQMGFDRLFDSVFQTHSAHLFPTYLTWLSPLDWTLNWPSFAFVSVFFLAYLLMFMIFFVHIIYISFASCKYIVKLSYSGYKLPATFFLNRNLRVRGKQQFYLFCLKKIKNFKFIMRRGFSVAKILMLSRSTFFKKKNLI